MPSGSVNTSSNTTRSTGGLSTNVGGSSVGKQSMGGGNFSSGPLGGGGMRDGGLRANGGGQMAASQSSNRAGKSDFGQYGQNIGPFGFEANRAAKGNFLGVAPQVYGPTQSYPSLANSVMGNTMGSPLNNVIQYGMPTTGTIQDTPGALRNPLLPSSPTRYHAGVDIKTAPGTPAVSMVPGKIAQIGNASGYGSFADVMNYDGTMTRYATHAGINPNLSVGDIVGKGQNIGTTGAVKPGGFSHLHMEQMTPSDRAFQQVTSAYNSGATANPGGFYGRTSSYDPNNIQTSTAGLLERLGLSTGTRVAAGASPAAPTQTAGNVPLPRPAPRPTQVAAGPTNLLSPNYHNPYSIFDDPEMFPQTVTPAAGSFPPTGFGPFSPQSGYVPQMGGVPVNMAQPGFGNVPTPRPRPDNLMTQPGFGPVPLPTPRPNFQPDGRTYGLMETLQGLFSGNPVPPNPGIMRQGGRERGDNRKGIRYINNFQAASEEELMKKHGLLPGQTSLI